MTNKKNLLISSLMTIAMSATMITGATFALFTDEVENNIVVNSGKIDVEATITDWSTWSMDVQQEQGKFENGGFADVDSVNGNVTLDKVTPGDTFKATVTVTNYSNVDVKYRASLSINGDLADDLTVTVNTVKYAFGETILSDWTFLTAGTQPTVTEMALEVALPDTVGDEAQNESANIKIRVEAVQGNTKIADQWDGKADTSWYNDTATEFSLDTSEQLAGLADLVNDGNTFAGKTLKLTSNLNLETYDSDGERVTFTPIGNTSDDGVFEGTFDGDGHTIENLYQNGWDLGYEWGSYGSYGLFGEVKDATIKNVTVSGAESYIEGGDVGGITGSASGTCVFENITITDSDFATYNNGNGGIIGWSGAGNYTFKNITIAEDVTLAGLWGSFDSSIGGVVGQGEPGATYNFENVDIACRLDVYNDCTASYDYYNYRMCGMIIGRLAETTTIEGTNYPDTSKYNITCKDVTVTYGDWANYHYCRAEGARGIRVEAGYQYDGIAADYDHSICTQHHMELIAFDQIFGGDQYGVKGLPSYEGVEVIYNNQ